jgi:hypothetical protein
MSNSSRFFRGCTSLVPLSAALALLASPVATPAFAQFTIGPDASNYAVLYEGGGTGNTLQVTNVTVNGSVGDGGAGKVSLSGPGKITGALDVAASNSSQVTGNGVTLGSGPNYNVARVTNALNTVNALNSTLGAESGNGLSINLSGNTTQTINITSGKNDNHGNYVFNITQFNTTNGNTLNIVGDGTHSVVFNFTSSANFNNQVTLSNISSDQVLWNFVGGANLSGGPTLAINTNASSNPSSVGAYGDFLDPNGPISVTNANVFGRVFGGDSHDMQIVSGDTINQPASPPVPEPSSVILLCAGGAAFAGLRAWRRKSIARS